MKNSMVQEVRQSDLCPEQYRRTCLGNEQGSGSARKRFQISDCWYKSLTITFPTIEVLLFALFFGADAVFTGLRVCRLSLLYCLQRLIETAGGFCYSKS